MYAVRSMGLFRSARSVSSARSALRTMCTESAQAADLVGGRVGNTYAKALYGSCLKKDAFDKVTADVMTLQKYRNESPTFEEFLKNPVLGREFKANLLKTEIAPNMGLSETTTEFLGVVADNGRSMDLGSILATFLSTYTSEEAAAKGLVTVAKPLTDWQRAALEKQLIGLFYPDGSKSSIDVEYKLDSSLLGGFTAEIDDRFVDMSLRQEVQQVEEIVGSA